MQSIVLITAGKKDLSILTLNNELVDSFTDFEKAKAKSEQLSKLFGVGYKEVQYHIGQELTYYELLNHHLMQYQNFKESPVIATLTTDTGIEIIFDAQSYFVQAKVEEKLPQIVREIFRLKGSKGIETDSIVEYFDDYIGNDLNLLAVRTTRKDALGYNCRVDIDSLKAWTNLNAPDLPKDTFQY
ncbi:hypothetical protein F7U66_02025 [Vibrio parahaemolyticus]|nr:hypothetical protein [Vibrio parahaemolyticus]